jgi:serine/threonine protein kinase
VVIKRQDLSKMYKDEMDQAIDECEKLEKLEHENIIKFIDVFHVDRVLFIVMKWAN